MVLRVLGRRGLRVSAAAVAVVAVGIVALRWWPISDSLLRDAESSSTIVVDRHGTVLYEALSTTGARARRLEASSFPPLLASATIAAEDRRFLSHPGVDPWAWLRAARNNLSEGRVVEGASTITQQVAKLLLQRRDGVKRRGVAAKLHEMALAIQLEHRFTKREILALYLNLASYGSQTSGAGRASELYFGVDPDMLTPAQSAFLAGLPQRPTAFNPLRNLPAAQARQRTVLRRMAAAGGLTADQLRDALAERLAI